MATIKFKGLEEYELQLSRLEKMTPEIAGRAIYQGAKIVADEIRKEIEDLPKKVQPKSFYEELKPQIEKLFSENKQEDYLEKIFQNSKWVRVNLQNDDYYVFGLIFENENVKYICYGVPGVYQKNPPRELSGSPSWLALDSQNREGFGYWISYQDAQSGENVKAIVE